MDGLHLIPAKIGHDLMLTVRTLIPVKSARVNVESTSNFSPFRFAGVSRIEMTGCTLRAAGKPHIIVGVQKCPAGTMFKTSPGMKPPVKTRNFGSAPR